MCWWPASAECTAAVDPLHSLEPGCLSRLLRSSPTMDAGLVPENATEVELTPRDFVDLAEKACKTELKVGVVRAALLPGCWRAVQTKEKTEMLRQRLRQPPDAGCTPATSPPPPFPAMQDYPTEFPGVKEKFYPYFCLDTQYVATVLSQVSGKRQRRFGW